MGFYRLLHDEILDYISSNCANSGKKPDFFSERVSILRDAAYSSSMCSYGGVLYYFGGRYYERLDKECFSDMVYCLFRELGYNGLINRLDTVVRVMLRCAYGKSVTLDGGRMVFSNCIYDMDEKQSMRFTPDVFLTSGVDYPYLPKEDCPKWKQFLCEVLPSEKQRSMLKRFLGSIFIDRKTAKLEHMLVLLGSGANGKSVVFETVTSLLGKGNVTNFGISDIISGSERKRNVATMNGKRLNYCSELRLDELKGSGDELKSLISGEPMDARAMYGDNFMAYDIPLIMANANKMPFLRDYSYSLRRRILVIPFSVKIPPALQDKELPAKLREELPGIFNWVMEGRDEFISSGYHLEGDSEMNAEAISRFSDAKSPIRAMSALHMNPVSSVESDVRPMWRKASTIYSKYVSWCLKNGVVPEMPKTFFEIISEAGFVKKRSNKGVLYAVYGDHPSTEEERKKREIYLSDRETYMSGGKEYIKTIKSAARLFGITRDYFAMIVRRGELGEFVHAEKNTHVFDVAGCFKYLSEHGYIKSDIEKKKISYEKSVKGLEAWNFNKRMKYKKLPYRKYLMNNHKEKGTEVVGMEFKDPELK